MRDPISGGKINLPDFVWCNWLLETAKLRADLRIVIDTRMSAWRIVTVDNLEIQLRDLMMQPEIPEHRVGTGRASHARFTEEYDEGYEDEYEDQEDDIIYE